MSKRKSEDAAASAKAKAPRFLTPETVEDSDSDNEGDGSRTMSFAAPSGYAHNPSIAGTIKGNFNVSGDKELWLIRVPRTFKAKNLDGASIKLRDDTIFTGAETKERFQVSSVNKNHLVALTRNPNHPAMKEFSNLIAVTSTDGKLGFGGHFEEEIVISAALDALPAAAPAMYKPRVVKQLPGLRQRITAFGAGFAAPEDAATAANDDAAADEAESTPVAMDTTSKKDKKDKKDKNASTSSSSSSSAAAPMAIDDDDNNTATVAIADKKPAAAAADVDAASKKDKKKDKKKEKDEKPHGEHMVASSAKSKSTESESAAAAAAAAAPEKRKKDKKDKSGDDDRSKKTRVEEAQPAAEEQEVAVFAEASASKSRSDKKFKRLDGGSFRKDFYTLHPTTAAMSQADVEAYRNGHGISIRLPEAHGFAKSAMLNPILAFNQAGFPEDLLTACAGFASPTPIQSQCWPISLAGKDLIGIAKTGSGKTLAFALPSIIHLRDQEALGKSSNQRGPVVLVLCPTRELAMQTAEVYANVASHTGKSSSSVALKTVCIFGGVPKKQQLDQLKSGIHVIVATPGRLRDFIDSGDISLQRVSCVILDEADRMLDLGFEKDIRDILGRVTKDRQTLMFSATWPSAIEAIGREFLAPDTVRVTIGGDELVANDAVTQHVEVLEPFAKDARLLDLLQKHHSSRKNKVIIFVLYKQEAPRVEQMLLRKGWKSIAIHGDRSQADRTAALQAFKTGEVPLLIATDVAARGLDIPNVEYVINYTFPLTIEDYVHRIGRTGRAGKTGTAFTFFTVNDKSHSGELVNVLRETNQAVPDALMKFGTHVKKKEHKLYGLHFRDDAAAGPMPAASRITFDDD